WPRGAAWARWMRNRGWWNRCARRPGSRRRSAHGCRPAWPEPAQRGIAETVAVATGAFARPETWVSRRGRGPETPGSARRRRQLARVEESVAVHVLPGEALGQARKMLRARQRPALAAGLLLGRQHAVAVAVHAVEGIAHPGLVLGQRDAAVLVAVHAGQVLVGPRDLGQACDRPRKQAGRHHDRGAAAPGKVRGAAPTRPRARGAGCHQARTDCSE